MSSDSLIDLVVDTYEALGGVISHNSDAIDIYEGNLLPHVVTDLKDQLSGPSFEAAKARIAPINLLTKIVDKTSAIYQPGPVRRIIDGNDGDEELLSLLIESMDIDAVMQQAAAMLVLCKTGAVQPYIHEGKTRARVILNDRFFVLSLDPVDPLTPTHFVTVSHEMTELGGRVALFYVYSAEGWFVCDSERNLRGDKMDDGFNPYGAVPFLYVNSSKTRLTPKPDTDILKMTKLIPTLMSDLNYAVMYQSFAIVYGIDIDDNGLKRAPNAFWAFKSDPTTDKKPEVGTIKPTVDIDAVLGLIQSELSLWLNSRGIRPGTVGQLNGDQFANGISKMIDEMDTFEARERLQTMMVKAERCLWDLVIHKMYPAWVAMGLSESTQLFSPGCSVETVFHAQAPMVSRGALVDDLKKEVDAKFTTRKRAIQKLNPQLSDKEVEQLMAEIDKDKAAQPEPVATPFAPKKANGDLPPNAKEGDDDEQD